MAEDTKTRRLRVRYTKNADGDVMPEPDPNAPLPKRSFLKKLVRKLRGRGQPRQK